MKTRIYLVDDEPAVCRIMKSMLAGAGFDLIVETDSSKAAQRIPMEKFDAVFLDINMPPPNGLELARIQRAGGFNLRTPIVMISGSDDPKVLSKGYTAGGNFFLFKPFDKESLLRTMRATQDFIEMSKQRFQRVPVSLPITIETNDEIIAATTVDMSLDGLLVQSPKMLPPETIVVISFILPGARASIRIEARMLKAIEKDHLVILFQKMEQEDKDALRQFMLPLVLGKINWESSQPHTGGKVK
jgi:CheY-like chemotaxis protein